MLTLPLKFQKGIHKIKRIISTPNPAKIKRINFAITYLCNSQCKICSIWKKYRNDTVSPQQELDFSQIKRLFNQNKSFKELDEISLTGGEPFLRHDFRDIYQFFRQNFPRATIIINTNGLQAKDNWIKTKEDALWTVVLFSLDGLEETNDLIRGIEGSYQRVISTIKHYQKVFPSLRMGLSFTILPTNFHELREIYDLSRRLKLSFTMRFACNSEIYYNNSEIKLEWTDEMLRNVDADIQLIVKETAQSRNRLNRLLNPDLFFYSRMVYYQRNKKRLFQCFSGVHSLFLDPYGNIFPCIFLVESIGNVTKEPFDDLWFSKKAGQQRISIANEECHCWTECETIPSLQRNLGHLNAMETQ